MTGTTSTGTPARGETDLDGHFTTPSGHIGGSGRAGGITFVASTGDSGSPGQWPAYSPNVLAVGGTSLYLNSAGNYSSEVGWTSSGGGISSREGKPNYQNNVTLGGNHRTAPDVAYDADASTGFAVYDSVGSTGGWILTGGTSAGAPQWAALIALADQVRAVGGYKSLDGPSQTLPAIYNLPSNCFHDIVSGNNGYAAGPGYDLVTGRGTPYADRIISAVSIDVIIIQPPQPMVSWVSTNYPPLQMIAAATGGTAALRQPGVDALFEQPGVVATLERLGVDALLVREHQHDAASNVAAQRADYRITALALDQIGKMHDLPKIGKGTQSIKWTLQDTEWMDDVASSR